MFLAAEFCSSSILYWNCNNR